MKHKGADGLLSSYKCPGCVRALTYLSANLICYSCHTFWSYESPKELRFITFVDPSLKGLLYVRASEEVEV